MKHTKGFVFLGAAFLAALTLIVAYGIKKDSEQENPVQTKSESVRKRPSISQGENKWPNESFISKEMEYKGKGEIVYTENIDKEKNENHDKSWVIFYKDANLNDVKTYIETLKSKKFEYTGNDKEPTIEFKNGMFSWQGKSHNNQQFVSIFITDNNALTTAGDLQNNIFQNMCIRLSNYDINEEIKNDLESET